MNMKRENDSVQNEHIRKAAEKGQYDEMEKEQSFKGGRARRIMRRKPYYMTCS